MVRCECGRPATYKIGTRWKSAPDHPLCLRCFKRLSDRMNAARLTAQQVSGSKPLGAITEDT